MIPLRCLLPVLVWAALAFGAADGPPAYRIETVAGSGGNGDGGPATLAQIGAIQGIALDRSGNIYLSDTDHHRVRKISPAGIITTIAGTGVAGFSGDGGAAASAQLNLPYGLAVDLSGSLYIADLGNNRVRRVDSTGTISTFAAQLATPRNIVVDTAGVLYVSEFDGHRVRRITADGKLATFAGTGVAGSSGDGGRAVDAQLNCPAGLAIDGSGTIYVADSQNNRIRKITANGMITTAAADIPTPRAVAVDAVGTLYIADSAAGVYGYTAAGGTSVIEGDGVLANILDLALDANGNVVLADDVHLRKVDALGNVETIAGDAYLHALGDGGAAVNAILLRPASVALDRAGNLYIADPGTQRVRQVSAAQTIGTIAGTGIAVWGATPDYVPAITSGLNSPLGVAIDPQGSLYIADTYNHNIRKVGSDGLIATVAGISEGGRGPDLQSPLQTQLSGPQSVCFDRAGTLYVVDSANHRVLRMTTAYVQVVAGNGVPGDSGDGGPAKSAQLNMPAACALDSLGNLFITDTMNHRVRKVNPAGVISTVAGSATAGLSGDEDAATKAQLQTPHGVAVDDSGDIFIADTGNHRIALVTPDGMIHTIAGQGTAGFQGDGGPGLQALLASPRGLFLDGAGALYLADTGNDRVRRLVPWTSNTVLTSLPGASTLTALNGASLRPGPIAPGEIVVLSGSGLGPTSGVGATFESGQLPTTLGEVEVRFDGVRAALLYAQASQINLQAPYELAGKTSTHIEVWFQGKSIASADLSVAPAAPALYPVVANADGSANSASQRASAGSRITLYATGEGLSDGANVSGRTAQSPYPHPRLAVSLNIGGVAAQMIDASSAPGVVGILQISARIPTGITPGQASLQLTVGGIAAPVIPVWITP